MSVHVVIENVLPAASAYAPDPVTLAVGGLGIVAVTVALVYVSRRSGPAPFSATAALIVGVLLIVGAGFLDTGYRMSADTARQIAVEKWLSKDFGIVVDQEDVVILTRGADSVWRNWVAVEYAGERTEIKLRDNGDHSFTVIDADTGKALRPTR